MKPLRDMPIRQKLTLVMLATSATSLLVAGAALMFHSFYQFRQGVVDDVKKSAAAINVPATASALAFEDNQTAQESLQGLALAPEIVLAVIRRNDGEICALYERNAGALPIPTLHHDRREHLFHGGRLLYQEPILFERDRVGHLLLIADLAGYNQRVRDYMVGLVLVLLTSTLLALYLARVFQRVVSEPIIALQRVTDGVTNRRDYGLRAQQHGTDEIGRLTEAFNQMLAQIEKSDATLRMTNDKLQGEVAERMAADQSLRQSNRFIAGITDGTPNILYLFDFDDVRPLYVNAQITRVLGYRPEQVRDTGSPFLHDFMHPDDKRHAEEHLRKLAGAHRGEVVEREFRVRNAAGQWRWVNSHETVYVRHDSGLPKQVLGTIMDITARREAEDKLREAEARLRFLIENVPAVTYSADFGEKGQWRYISPQVEQLTGFTPAEWTSDVTLWHRQIHPDDRAFAMNADEQCSVTGSYQAEYRLITKDGRTVWCRDEGRAVLDQNGKPSYLQGVILDITGRKNAEEQLRLSEERFRQLAETIKEVFWLTDPSKNEMVYISPSYESIWGRTCEGLYSNPRGWMEVIHPDDRDRVMKTATTRQITGKYDEEYRIIRPDGTIRWIRDRAYPVRDPHGRVYRIAGIAEDITHRRSIEDALRDAEEKWRSLVENSRDYILTINPDAIITFINRLQPNLSVKNVIGSSMYEFVLPDSQRIVRRAIEHVFAKGESTRYEIRGVGSDNAEAWYESRVVPIKKGDVVSAALIIATDVTERKRLESEILAISDREQQRIGQDLHDDLCQRLAASAFAMSALETQLHGSRSVALAKETREIATMITTSISMARNLARGLYPVQLEKEGLQHALRDLALTTSDRFALDCRYSSDESVIVEDHNAALHLFRIAQEAVHNAVRHADASRIEIGLHSDETGVMLTVLDNGIGLAGSKPNASGMGLNIMNYRARIIGAQFEIQSGPNCGTSIRCLYVPPPKPGVAPKGTDGIQEQ